MLIQTALDSRLITRQATKQCGIMYDDTVATVASGRNANRYNTTRGDRGWTNRGGDGRPMYYVD